MKIFKIKFNEQHIYEVDNFVEQPSTNPDTPNHMDVKMQISTSQLDPDLKAVKAAFEGFTAATLVSVDEEGTETVAAVYSDIALHSFGRVVSGDDFVVFAEYAYLL